MKFKAVCHSEMLNVGSSTYVDKSTVNTTTQNIFNSQNINEANITTTCTIKHDTYDGYCFHSIHDVQIFTGKHNVCWILSFT
jgi:hypothetical protein